MDDVKAILSGEKEGQVADNRDEDEWNGEYSGYGYHDLAGKIEGSVWCSSGDEENGEYFTNIDGTARTQQELKAYMESNGLDTSKTVAFSVETVGEQRRLHTGVSLWISTILKNGEMDGFHGQMKEMNSSITMEIKYIMINILIQFLMKMEKM